MNSNASSQALKTEKDNIIIPCCIVIGVARADSKGGTSVLYALKLNDDNSTEGDPFQLLDSKGRYIWQNDDLCEEGVKTRSVVRLRKFGDQFLFDGNTGVRWVRV